MRAAVLLWGGWAVVASVVLSMAQGIWHAYYTIELAPAYAALIAIAATLLGAGTRGAPAPPRRGLGADAPAGRSRSAPGTCR